jgi:hypothetical protein
METNKDKHLLKVTDMATFFTKLEELVSTDVDPLRDYISNKFSLSNTFSIIYSNF